MFLTILKRKIFKKNKSIHSLAKEVENSTGIHEKRFKRIVKGANPSLDEALKLVKFFRFTQIEWLNLFKNEKQK